MAGRAAYTDYLDWLRLIRQVKPFSIRPSEFLSQEIEIYHHFISMMVNVI